MAQAIPRPNGEAADEDHHRRIEHALVSMRRWAAETERIERRIAQELDHAQLNAHINEDPRAVLYNFERSPLAQTLNGDLIGAHRRLVSYAAVVQAETLAHQQLPPLSYLFPRQTHLRDRAKRVTR